jgi:hypothetical protein
MRRQIREFLFSSSFYVDDMFHIGSAIAVTVLIYPDPMIVACKEQNP